jgi:hypothetical protein
VADGVFVVDDVGVAVRETEIDDVADDDPVNMSRVATTPEATTDVSLVQVMYA